MVGLESMLWKYAFYRPIRDFRQRMDKEKSNIELSQKIRDAYVLFLKDGIEFYDQLSGMFREKMMEHNEREGMHHVESSMLGTRSEMKSQSLNGTSDIRLAWSRSLICSGDLERYLVYAEKAALVEKCGADMFDIPEKLASEAVAAFTDSWKSYASAAVAFPISGNAWNQLAVLSSLQGDVLSATYLYLRAAFAPRSFDAAKGNLGSLFSRMASNKSYNYRKENSHSVDHVPKTREVRKGLVVQKVEGNKKQAKQQNVSRGCRKGNKSREDPPPGSCPTQQLIKNLSRKSIKLIACLYCRIDIDDVPKIIEELSIDLDELLYRIRSRSSGACGKSTLRRISGINDLTSRLLEPPHYLLSLISSIIMLIFTSNGSQNDHLSFLGTNIAPREEANCHRDEFSCSTYAVRLYAIYAFTIIARKFLIASALLPIDMELSSRFYVALSCPILLAVRPVIRWILVTKAECILPTRLKAADLPAWDMKKNAEIAAEKAIDEFQSNIAQLWVALKTFADPLGNAITLIASASDQLPENVFANLEASTELILPEDMQLIGYAPLIELKPDSTDSFEVQDQRNVPSAEFISRVRAVKIWKELNEISAHAERWLGKSESYDCKDELIEAVKSFVKAMKSFNVENESDPSFRSFAPVRNMQTVSVMNTKRKSVEDIGRESKHDDTLAQDQDDEVILFHPGQRKMPNDAIRMENDVKLQTLGGVGNAIHEYGKDPDYIHPGENLQSSNRTNKNEDISTELARLSNIEGKQWNTIASVESDAVQELCKEQVLVSNGEEIHHQTSAYPLSDSYLSLVPSHLPTAKIPANIQTDQPGHNLQERARPMTVQYQDVQTHSSPWHAAKSQTFYDSNAEYAQESSTSKEFDNKSTDGNQYGHHTADGLRSVLFGWPNPW